jgi:hypothetical protein
MSRPRGNRKEARLSVSLDEQDYAALTSIARRSDVSIAWLARQAIQALIDREKDKSELPLVRQPGRATS